jgi:flagellar motor switch protein FliM
MGVMATTQAQPAPVNEELRDKASEAETPENNAEQALIPVAPSPVEEEAEEVFSPLVALLPVELDVAVPVQEFRVRQLLSMTPGTIIETRWGHPNDVPLSAGEVQLAWSEFEVVDAQLAVRVTRLVQEDELK